MVLLWAPPDAPVSPAPVWSACQHTWQAWDGTEWDLSHGQSGLALQRGVRGHEDPGVTHYRTPLAGIDGSFWRGCITEERTCFWPLLVMSDGGSLAWIEHYRRFWRTMRPTKTGRWIIAAPDGTRRHLTVRFNDLEPDSDAIDPTLVGYGFYGLNLTAEQPFWMGDPITRTFVNAAAGENFYGGSAGGGFGPPYFLSPSVTTANATINNPGDEDVSPVITIYGPCTTAAVGVDGRLITFPAPLTAGQWVRIDTDPTDRVALNQAGADVTPLFSTVEFARVPAGDEVPLDISMTGTGSVEVTVTPAFRSAI